MLYVLHETAAGIAVLAVREYDNIAKFTREVQGSVADYASFSRLVKLVTFHRFNGNDEAAAIGVALDEGTFPKTTVSIIEAAVLPTDAKAVIGVVDERLKQSAAAKLPGVSIEYSPLIVELSRGVRRHFARLVGSDVTAEQIETSARGLAHLVSRQLVSFDKNRADSMVIQSVAHLDNVTKSVNTLFMRLAEWYGYHFPELRRICGEHHELYCDIVLAIHTREALLKDRALLTKMLAKNDALREAEAAAAAGDATAGLAAGAGADAGTGAEQGAVLNREHLAAQIVGAAQVSTGMAVQPEDEEAVLSLARRTKALFTERRDLALYLANKMAEIAPNTSTLLGAMNASKVIARAGGLRALAKVPASTIQILGAEKALFRCLKMRSSRTPKYGILFNFLQVTRTDPRNKGRVARALACCIARTAKVDYYSIEKGIRPVFGSKLRMLMDAKVAFYRTGKNPPPKNMELMKEVAKEMAEARKARA